MAVAPFPELADRFEMIFFEDFLRLFFAVTADHSNSKISL